MLRFASSLRSFISDVATVSILDPLLHVRTLKPPIAAQAKCGQSSFDQSIDRYEVAVQLVGDLADRS